MANLGYTEKRAGIDRGLASAEKANMARFKVFPRYRRPSLKMALGVTRAKRRLGKVTGYYALSRVPCAHRAISSGACCGEPVTIAAR